MNSQQLVSVLKQDRYTAPLFRGVYPINRLPPIREGLYVVNTAPHTHPGLHWIALFVKDGMMEYFDSYATMGQEKRMGEQSHSSSESADIGVWAVLSILSISPCSGDRYDHLAHGFRCRCG